MQNMMLSLCFIHFNSYKRRAVSLPFPSFPSDDLSTSQHASQETGVQEMADGSFFKFELVSFRICYMKTWTLQSPHFISIYTATQLL